MLVGDLLLLNEGMIEFLVRVKHWEEGSRMVVVEEQSHPSLTDFSPCVFHKSRNSVLL